MLTKYSLRVINGVYHACFRTKGANDEIKQHTRSTDIKATKGDAMEVPVYLGIYFGLRRSEVVGLRWKDIDLVNRTLTINSTVVNSSIAKTTIFREGVTKTSTSYRTFGLGEENVKYFTNLKKKQEAMPRYTEDYKDFVCVDEGGNLLKPDRITDNFIKLIDRVGMPKIRFHDLRHSCITYIVRNFGLKVGQAYAGHASITTTVNIPYGHTLSKQPIFDIKSA